MRLGVKQVLTVVKLVDFGVYLGSDEERVLLPKKQVPDGIELGDPIEVFLYKDSSDRMIATTNERAKDHSWTAGCPDSSRCGQNGCFS